MKQKSYQAVWNAEKCCQSKYPCSERQDIWTAWEKWRGKNYYHENVAWTYTADNAGSAKPHAIKDALAIMHDPELLILDEPINGLDPIGIIDKGVLFFHI